MAKSDSGPTELAPQFGRYRVKKKLGGGLGFRLARFPCGWLS
jgi:hypothetical protein